MKHLTECKKHDRMMVGSGLGEGGAWGICHCERSEAISYGAVWGLLRRRERSSQREMHPLVKWVLPRKRTCGILNIEHLFYIGVGRRSCA